jgi:hypothetical protein
MDHVVSFLGVLCVSSSALIRWVLSQSACLLPRGEEAFG